jgi:hypothetical protein
MMNDSPVDLLAKQAKDGTAFLQWDREVNSKLYYGFWIMFLGGFVLSLGPTITHTNSAQCILIWLYAFRISALVGVVINFLLQSFAINAVREARKYSNVLEMINTCVNVSESLKTESLKVEAENNIKLAKSIKNDLKWLDRGVETLHILLLFVAALFLVAGTVITWGIVPANH